MEPSRRPPSLASLASLASLGFGLGEHTAKDAATMLADNCVGTDKRFLCFFAIERLR